MKLNKDFITYNSGDDHLLVPSGNVPFTGIVRGNKTFGSVLELLKTDTTEEEIIKQMADRFDAEKEIIRKDVERALAELKKIGALDE